MPRLAGCMLAARSLLQSAERLTIITIITIITITGTGTGPTAGKVIHWHPLASSQSDKTAFSLQTFRCVLSLLFAVTHGARCQYFRVLKADVKE